MVPREIRAQRSRMNKPARLALYTFGLFRAPADAPLNDEFHARGDMVLEEIERAAGFIARSGYDDDVNPAPWGEQIFPHFYVEEGDGWAPSTLSLWRDLAAPVAYTYHGRLHAEALRKGAEWFRSGDWPPYVAWWTTDAEPPNWTEGVKRFEALAADGPSPDGFMFGAPFDETGAPTKVAAADVRAYVAKNALADADRQDDR